MNFVEELKDWISRDIKNISTNYTATLHLDKFPEYREKVSSYEKLLFSVDMYKYLLNVAPVVDAKFKPILLVPLSDSNVLDTKAPALDSGNFLSPYESPSLCVMDRAGDMFAKGDEQYYCTLFLDSLYISSNVTIKYNVIRTRNDLMEGVNEYSRYIFFEYFPDELIG